MTSVVHRSHLQKNIRIATQHFLSLIISGYSMPGLVDFFCRFPAGPSQRVGGGGEFSAVSDNFAAKIPTKLGGGVKIFGEGEV